MRGAADHPGCFGKVQGSSGVAFAQAPCSIPRGWSCFPSPSFRFSFLNLLHWSLSLYVSHKSCFPRGCPRPWFFWFCTLPGQFHPLPGSTGSVSGFGDPAGTVTSTRRQYRGKWVRLCSHKTLFMDAELCISDNFHVSQNILLLIFFFSTT